jgi:hypothetical protein
LRFFFKSHYRVYVGLCGTWGSRLADGFHKASLSVTQKGNSREQQDLG